MPEARSELNSESNKKKIGTHFSPLLKKKKLLIHKKCFKTFMSNLIAHLIEKKSLFISVNS
jgi:hypothetical protein